MLVAQQLRALYQEPQQIMQVAEVGPEIQRLEQVVQDLRGQHRGLLEDLQDLPQEMQELLTLAAAVAELFLAPVVLAMVVLAVLVW